MKKFVILNWSCLDDLCLCYDEDGYVITFDTLEDAQDWARGALTAFFKVVEISE
jgi:hypothetical protein